MGYNRWLYAYANSVNLLDPTGRCPKNLPPEDAVECERHSEYASRYGEELRTLVSRPKRADGGPGRDVWTPPPGITWSPALSIGRASHLGMTQYDVDLDRDGKIEEEEIGNKAFGPNICGQASLSMVYEAITKGKYSLEKFWSASGKPTGPTDQWDLARALAIVVMDESGWDHWVHEYSSIYKVTVTPKAGSSGATEYEVKNSLLGGNPMNRNTGSSQFVTDSRGMLSSGHYFIPLVEVVKPSGALVPRGMGIRHWIVLAGMSAQWEPGNLDSEWNWVMLSNPYRNRVEYYTWKEFRLSVNPGLAVELWRD